MTHYSVTGSVQELKNLEFDNINQRFNQTLFTGDVRERIKILAESGQVILAYATAKVHGVQEYIDALEDAVPGIAQKVELPDKSDLLVPPKPLVGDAVESNKILTNWPMLDVEPETDTFENVSID